MPWLYVTGVYDAINSTVPIIGKSKQDLWDEFLEVNAFNASLWKIAEGAFCAIYYAYENLLVRMLAELRGSLIRVTDRDFTKELIKVYGESMANKIWTGNQISVAREVRNCITHNGGKASARLLSMRPRPRVESGDVLISASDVRVLYTRLKPIANEAINESVHRINAHRH